MPSKFIRNICRWPLTDAVLDATNGDALTSTSFDDERAARNSFGIFSDATEKSFSSPAK